MNNMKQESLVTRVLKYAVGGIVGAGIGSGIGIGITELEFLAYYFGDKVVVSGSDNRSSYMPFQNLVVGVGGILYLVDRGIDRAQKGAMIGFPLGLAGYHGIRKLRGRKERLCEQQENAPTTI